MLIADNYLRGCKDGLELTVTDGAAACHTVTMGDNPRDSTPHVFGQQAVLPVTQVMEQENWSPHTRNTPTLAKKRDALGLAGYGLGSCVPSPDNNLRGCKCLTVQSAMGPHGKVSHVNYTPASSHPSAIIIAK